MADPMADLTADPRVALKVDPRAAQMRQRRIAPAGSTAQFERLMEFRRKSGLRSGPK